MSRAVTLELELPDELSNFRLPQGVQRRLQDLLDRQDDGEVLTAMERDEARGLVEIAEILSLIQMRARCARAGNGESAS